jgi:FkbM family methyltransferase
MQHPTARAPRTVRPLPPADPVRRLVRRVVDRIPFLEKELFILGRLVPRGGVCLDVGAAGGAHAVVLSRAVGPTGQVHAFEPRPRSATWLQRVVGALALDNVTVHQTALGETPGVATMVVPGVRTEAHIATGAEDGDVRTVTVDVTTIDRFVADEGLTRLDLLKCDAEGHELDIIAGAAATIEAFRPAVLVESEQRHLDRSGRQLQELFDWFEARGYRALRYDRTTLVDDSVDSGDNDHLFLPV